MFQHSSVTRQGHPTDCFGKLSVHDMGNLKPCVNGMIKMLFQVRKRSGNEKIRARVFGKWAKMLAQMSQSFQEFSF